MKICVKIAFEPFGCCLLLGRTCVRARRYMKNEIIYSGLLAFGLVWLHKCNGNETHTNTREYLFNWNWIDGVKWMRMSIEQWMHVVVDVCWSLLANRVKSMSTFSVSFCGLTMPISLQSHALVRLTTIQNTKILIRTNVLNNFKNSIILSKPRASYTPIIIYTHKLICILTRFNLYLYIWIGHRWCIWHELLTLIRASKSHEWKNTMHLLYWFDCCCCCSWCWWWLLGVAFLSYLYILFASSQLAIFNVQIIGKHSFSYYIRVSTLLLILL